MFQILTIAVQIDFIDKVNWEIVIPITLCSRMTDNINIELTKTLKP